MFCAAQATGAVHSGMFVDHIDWIPTKQTHVATRPHALPAWTAREHKRKNTELMENYWCVARQTGTPPDEWHSLSESDRGIIRHGYVGLAAVVCCFNSNHVGL